MHVLFSSSVALGAASSTTLHHSTGRVSVIHWFYSTRGGDLLTSHTSLLKALLHQLLSQHSALFPSFTPPYRKAEPLTREWLTLETMKDILRRIAASGHQTICVVDAMDESDAGEVKEDKRREVLEFFISVASKSCMKFIILSRPTHDIEQEHWPHLEKRLIFRITMEKENEHVVKLVTAAGVKSLRKALELLNLGSQNSILPGESEFCDEVQSYLEKHAKGVILWISVVIQTLINAIESGFTFPALREEMRSLPEHNDMDELYFHIMEKLLAQDKRIITKTRKVLMWVRGANTMGVVRFDQLREALALDDAVRSSAARGSHGKYTDSDPIHEHLVPGSWAGFRLHLRKWCGALLDIRTTGANVRGEDLVQLLHRTVKDFLEGSKFTQRFNANSPGFAFTERDAIEMVRKAIPMYRNIAFPQVVEPLAPAAEAIAITPPRRPAQIYTIPDREDPRRPGQRMKRFIRQAACGLFVRSQEYHLASPAVAARPAPPLTTAETETVVHDLVDHEYYPLAKWSQDWTKRFTDMADYLNRRPLFTFILTLSEHRVANRWILGDHIHPNSLQLSKHPMFSTDYNLSGGGFHGEDFFMVLCMARACDSGLVLAADIILSLTHFIPGRKFWDAASISRFLYQLIHVALHASLEHGLHSRSWCLVSIQSSLSPELGLHSFWKMSEQTIDSRAINSSSFEVTAARAGNQEILDEVTRGTRAYNYIFTGPDKLIRTSALANTCRKAKAQQKNLVDQTGLLTLENIGRVLDMVIDHIKTSWYGYRTLKNILEAFPDFQTSKLGARMARGLRVTHQEPETSVDPRVAYVIRKWTTAVKEGQRRRAAVKKLQKAVRTVVIAQWWLRRVQYISDETRATRA